MNVRKLFAIASMIGALALTATSVTAQDNKAAPAAPAAAVTAPAPAPAPAPVAAPAPTPPPAAPVATATKAVDNPYGLKALWEQGDIVAKITLIILVIMSVASWYVLIVKFLEQNKLKAQAAEATKNFWGAQSVRQGADALKKDSAFKYIAEQGIEATKKHDGLLGNIDLNTWVTMSINRGIETVQSRLQEGLAILATVGSTAPFVGLFGTVWGIYNALVKIGVSGQASIDKVAGPVGESLIMTAIGLAVAVPAVLGYNWMVRRNKGVLEQVRGFGSELHAVLLAASGKRA